MNESRICPNCHYDNPLEAEFCEYCGQSLNADQLNPKVYNNFYKYSSLENKAKKSKVRKILVALFLIIIIIPVIDSVAIPIIHIIFPQKIVSVNDISAYVNQNDKFELPDKIGAKMNYGKNKAASVNWDTKEVDTSTAGTKLIKGKIDGYDREVCFKLTVLSNHVEQSIDDYVVENSEVDLNINLTQDIKWAAIQVSKDKNTNTQFYPVKNGVMDCSVYLPFGSGDYSLTIYKNSTDDIKSEYNGLLKVDVRNLDTRDMSFLLPDYDVQSNSEEIRNLAYKITANYVSDMDKTRAIHDWVCSNIAYDVDALTNNKLHDYSAIETLESRKVVCNGYANLTAALNRSIGIRCKIVSGTVKSSKLTKLFDNSNNSHAWNETYIDGKWIIQDTTWDAGTISPSTKKFKFNLSHQYFNPSSESFESTHTKTSER